jgi:hypothetical protein
VLLATAKHLPSHLNDIVSASAVHPRVLVAVVAFRNGAWIRSESFRERVIHRDVLPLQMIV